MAQAQACTRYLFPQGHLGPNVRALSARASSKRQDSDVQTGGSGRSQLPPSTQQAEAHVPHPSQLLALSAAGGQCLLSTT